MLRRDMVPCPGDRALQNSPYAFDAVAVDRPPNVFPGAVVHRLILEGQAAVDARIVGVDGRADLDRCGRELSRGPAVSLGDRLRDRFLYKVPLLRCGTRMSRLFQAVERTMCPTHSETADFKVTVKPDESWNKSISSIRKSGALKAKELRHQGHKFHVEILAPKEVRGGDTVPLSGVTIKLDWRIETRIKLVEAANSMIANAYLIDCLDPSLPTVLCSIIEGRGLYEHSIGEFFLLYGKFEQKYQLRKGKETRAKMLDLLKGDKQYLFSYKERRGTRDDPLPYAVRNILSHVGKNPNPLYSCAVERCRHPAGANPARQLSLQPVAIGAVEGGNDFD